MARAKNKIELLIEAKVKDAIQDLDKTEKELGQLARQGKKSSAVFKKLGTAAAGFMSVLAVKQVASYAIELAKIGDSAEQAEGPFRKFAKQAGKQMPAALNDLRKAVRGTASDMELMQRAGAAMDAFTASGLSAEEAFNATQKTMDFLYRYATKFGKNFNELMQTVFTGLQRGSALFLDDVGIMINQTGKQFQGLTDVEKKAKIVRVALEQMAKKNEMLGTVTEATNVRTRQAAAEYENFKAAIGKILNEPVGEFFGFLTDTLKGFTKGSAEAVTALKTQQVETEKTASKLLDLKKQYIELKDKANPTAEEQKKLNTVIADIASIIPGSITAVDQYGKALDINVKSINHFINAQRELLKRRESDVFGGIKGDIKDNISKLTSFNKALNKSATHLKDFYKAQEDGKKKVSFNTDVQTILMDTGIAIKTEIKNIEDYNKKISSINPTLDSLVEQLSVFIDLETSTPDKLSAELKISNEQAVLLIARFKELAKTPDEVIKTKWDKLRAAVKARYAEEIKAAGDKTEEVIRLKKLEAAEIAKIDAQEKEANKPGKKPKPAKDAEADAKRKASLELQLELNKIELDDTKNKYDKLREMVQARYAAEIKAAKGKTEIVAALRKLEADEITKIDNQEKEDRLKKEKEQAQKIKDIRENISLMGAKDEFQARMQEIENYYAKEMALAEGNEALLDALRDERKLKEKELYDDLAQQIADSYFEQHRIQASFKDAASAGYDSFVNHLTDTEMTGAEKRKAIWNDMQQAFISSLATSLKKYITTKMTELLFDTTVEKSKTKVKQSGAVQRVATDQIEIASSAEKTAANTSEAASGFFSAFSSIPWVGLALAVAAIGSMMAILSSIGKKSKGGIITGADLFKGVIPEGEDGILGVQEDEFVVNKKATRKNRSLLEAINQDKPLALSKQGNIGPLNQFSNELNTPQSLDKLTLPAGYSLNEIPAPQPVNTQREFYSYEKVIERTVPVEGKIVVETIAPDFAREKEHYVKINREINRPDNDYYDNNLRTEEGPY